MEGKGAGWSVFINYRYKLFHLSNLWYIHKQLVGTGSTAQVSRFVGYYYYWFRKVRYWGKKASGMESHCLVRSLCSCLWWLLQLFVRIQIKSSLPNGPNVSLKLVNHFELWHFDIICHLKFIGLDKFVAWTSVNSQSTRFSLSHPNNYQSGTPERTQKKLLRTSTSTRVFVRQAATGPRRFPLREVHSGESESVSSAASKNVPRNPRPQTLEANAQELCVAVLFHLPTQPGKLFGEKLLKVWKVIFW